MLAQHMRCEVAIEKPPLVDDFGLFDHSKNWERVGIVRAAVESNKMGSESAAGQQLQSIATHVVTIRFRVMKPEWRLIWKQTYLYIVNITNFREQDRFLEIHCRQENI